MTGSIAGVAQSFRLCGCGRPRTTGMGMVVLCERLKKLYKDGGIRRFYRGCRSDLQGPMSGSGRPPHTLYWACAMLMVGLCPYPLWIVTILEAT